MQKSDILQPQIEKLLSDMDFIDRYRAISMKFSKKDDTYSYSPVDVVEILSGLGIQAKVSNRDQFFEDYESIDDFMFRFGLTIKYNIVDFDSTIFNHSLGIKSGGSWGLIIQLMTNWNETMPKPGFSNFEQLTNLLKEAVGLHNEIKKAALKLNYRV